VRRHRRAVPDGRHASGAEQQRGGHARADGAVGPVETVVGDLRAGDAADAGPTGDARGESLLSSWRW
jgi:hypothetical protein